MDRRGFLKSISKVVAGCVAVPSVVKAKQNKPRTAIESTRQMADELLALDPNLKGKVSPKSAVDEIQAHQKFRKGDRVYVGNLPEWMSHFPSNCYATVLYSYLDKYQSEFVGNDYALDIDGKGFSAWYPEQLLTLIEPWAHSIMSQGFDKNKAIKLKFGNPEHVEIPGARAWLDECEDVINKELEKVNFPKEYIK